MGRLWIPRIWITSFLVKALPARDEALLQIGATSDTVEPSSFGEAWWWVEDPAFQMISTAIALTNGILLVCNPKILNAFEDKFSNPPLLSASPSRPLCLLASNLDRLNYLNNSEYLQIVEKLGTKCADGDVFDTFHLKSGKLS